MFNQLRRTLAYRLSLCFAWSVLAITAPPAWAQSQRVVQVEEHWELHLGQPDAVRSAPQITMVMSPTGNLETNYFLFTLNHNNVPDYRSGGLQVQHWDGSDLVSHHSAHEGRPLNYSDEVVTWVQRIKLEDGQLVFQVSDGTSETWGPFGGDDLSVSLPSSLTGLNGYKPAISLNESEVGYAENRVASLVLSKLVWVTEDGVVHEQNAPIPIDTSLE